MADLLVIVPSRGRPESVPRLLEAWHTTGAVEDGAALLIAVDADDPALPGYEQAVAAPAGQLLRQGCAVGLTTRPYWQAMVHKLNAVAAPLAGRFSALAFMGDDHLPRTPGWAGRYLAELRDLGTGIVYGDDGYQGEKLPTQWAMTADIVRALGRMVPAPVEHLYCDNSVLDLGQAAGCVRYLPDVVIEHMHPVAGKATTDAGYQRVNSSAQFRRDRTAYRRWQRTGLAADAATVRALRERAESHA